LSLDTMLATVVGCTLHCQLVLLITRVRTGMPLCGLRSKYGWFTGCIGSLAEERRGEDREW